MDPTCASRARGGGLARSGVGRPGAQWQGEGLSLAILRLSLRLACWVGDRRGSSALSCVSLMTPGGGIGQALSLAYFCLSQLVGH